MPTFGSLFSGVGGLDLGLERAGFECRWQCELDPWRRGILERNWPGVERHADVRDFGPRKHQRERLGRGSSEGAASGSEQELPVRVDLICGGFPCQDVSVAGRRAGLAGARSGLFHEFARIASVLRPEFLLVENVPGLLTSNGGRDFGVVLGTLADIGYGVAWRVLDSRFFGVPQRRRRVFIVGALPGGDLGARRAGEVLAAGTGCERHPAKGGAARTRVAGTLEGGASGRGWRVGADEAGGGTSLSGLGSGGPDDNDAQAGRIIAHPVARRGRDGESEFEMGEDETMFALRAGNGGSSRQPMVTHSLTSEGHDASEDGTGRGTPMVVRMREGKPGGGKDPLLSEDMSLTLGQANDQTLFGTLRGFGHGWQGQHNDDAQKAGMVRRLTPVECCRLQGFPDDWLGEPNVLPDSPRYAAMGDAVTVNVAEWIGRRLMEAM